MKWTGGTSAKVSLGEARAMIVLGVYIGPCSGDT